jgi:hypothetical protein
MGSMAKSYDFNKYASWSYDDDFCLKPPLLLTATVLYLCRSFLIMMLVLAASTRGRPTGMETFLPSGEHPMSIGLTAVPALLVLYARIRRTVAAGKFVRWLWKHGRVLLATSAAMEIGTAVLLLSISASQPGDSDLLRVTFLILDVYILLYVLLSKHVRDVFSDFPPP